MDGGGGGETSAKIDHDRQLYPNCIVWSPLPPITWIFPFIGHMGIADSKGIMNDFAGPYTIGKGRLAFGAPTRYIQLDLKAAGGSIEYDGAIEGGNRIYSQRMHNLFCDNCHSHVARCLNDMNYAGGSHYNMVVLAVWLFLFGKYVSFAAFLKTWLPFAIVLTLTLVFKLK